MKNNVDPVIKQKWVQALRSGQYRQQTNEKLRDDEGFCCLGVLCDLYVQQHPDVEWEQDEDGRYTVLNGGDSLQGGETLPPEVMQWAGLAEESGWLRYGFPSLTTLNDDYQYTFEQIADEIEARL